MSVDLRSLHRWLVSELQRHRSVADSMNDLIDVCEAAVAHPDWQRLRSLPYTDLGHLPRWLMRPFVDEPPERPLRGLWFGLFNPCPDGRTPVADMYLCGSERFNPDPLDNSWAVGPDWWPAARYARSPVLSEIYRIAYCQGAPASKQGTCLGNDAEYPLCLGYAAFSLKALLSQTDATLLLGNSHSLGIAVGFDSGDFLLLGYLTSEGLVPTAAAK